MQIVQENSTATVLIDAPPHLELRQELITVSLSDGITVIDGVAQGQRGPQGDSAGIEIPFAYGDASPLVLTTALADKIIERATIYITVPFDGISPSLYIGDADQLDRIMTTAEVDPTEGAVYQTAPGFAYEAETEILLSIDPGLGASQGSGLVVIEIQK